MRKIGLIFSALFMTAALTVSIASPTIAGAAQQVSIPSQLIPKPAHNACSAYSCSPGASGNTACQGHLVDCGNLAVCLSYETGTGNRGRCNGGNGGQF